MHRKTAAAVVLDLFLVQLALLILSGYYYGIRVLILALKPFGVGDYISTGSSEGTVQQISLFATKLLTVDNRAIIIPSSERRTILRSSLMSLEPIK